MLPLVQYTEYQKKNVTENHPLKPLTLYNKYKGLCEPLLFKHTDNNFEGVIFRPALYVVILQDKGLTSL